MTKKSTELGEIDAELVRSRVEELVRNFELELRSGDLRSKVLALTPIFHSLRDLGKVLIPSEYTSSARDRILYYFRQYPKVVISGEELMVISGIQEYARRVRELRVQFGWPIASGVTIRAMQEEEGEAVSEGLASAKPDDYVLLETKQDKEAAFRWNVANSIRRGQGSVRDKILEYLKSNVGLRVTGEELRYVAKDRTEWARRVRELRTEFGWPVVTKTTGRPDLPVGVYTLESDRQTPSHDRHIPDDVRCDVLRSENYTCTQCGWSHADWNRSDPRHLELHHIQHHVAGGGNVRENLRTLCTVCHDSLHRLER